MPKRRSLLTRWWLLAICAISVLSGCQKSQTSSVALPSADSRLNVLATVGMVADVVRQVGGDDVHVTQLMGSGVDPHLYKATRDDVRQIMTADLIFTSGLMLEGRLEDTFNKISRNRPVFAMTSRLPKDLLLSEPGGEQHPDPHVWMDVAAWANCLDVLVDGLSQEVPDKADRFRSQADHFRKTLQALHEYGLTAIASIPEERRVLVTSHDAFSYFGRAYGLEVIGVQGLSTESEAGLQRINELVDLLVSRKVAAVFVESSVPQKNMLALIDGARSRGHNVMIGGELYSDAMGPHESYEGTYVGMLDHNFTTVARALGGSVPERGFSGKLRIAERAQ